MARSANQKMKLMYLQKLLLEQTDEEHPITVQQMIDYLAKKDIHAERKSIYEDLNQLDAFGMDIVKNKSKTMGYYVGSRAFELAELKILVDVVQCSRFITKRKSEELIHKIEGLASEHEAHTLQRQVFVANRVKTMNESIYYNIDRLHEAIMKNRRIRCIYTEWVLDFTQPGGSKKQNRRGDKEYEISPWALTYDDENYYLVGYDAEAAMVKHYRVDKMEQINICKETRQGQELFDRFDTAAYTRKMFGMYGGTEEMVKLKMANRLIGVVRDRFGTEVTVQKENETHFTVRVPAKISPNFFGWLAGFGAEATIVAPEGVAQAYREHIEGVLQAIPDGEII